MFETPITIVGNIVTDPQFRVVGGDNLISFRVASNSRRRRADGVWEPGNSLYVTVNCWGRLANGVGGAFGKGAPVIVVGTVHTSEYVDKEGIKRSNLELRASAVGPDVSRTFVRILKPGYGGIEPSRAVAPVDEAPPCDSDAPLPDDYAPPPDVEGAGESATYGPVLESLAS